MVKDNVVKLSTIYVHSDSITTQSISQMTHFFCLNGPLDRKMQNPGENTEVLLSIYRFEKVCFLSENTKLENF